MTTVEVEQGKLKGARIGDSETDYVAFKGIPYARPPLGILRFKAPEPPQDWEGVRDATAHGPVCPQYNDRLQRLEAGSEDCLYLNVYSKTLAPPQPLPVMVWIHERAFQLGKLLGLETEDPQALSTFLKNAPVSDLVNIKLPPIETKHKDLTDSILFGPVVENAETDVDHFITKPPPELVRSGCFAKVPIILGFTSGEGMELGKHFPANLNLLLNTGAVVPRELKLTLTEQQLRHADIEIRKYYFKEKPLTADMLQEVVNLETDRLFVYNIIRFARYHSYFTSSPVYMYKFTAETERNYVKKFYKMDSISGCCHADDLYYLFNVTCQDVPLTSNSQQIIDNFVQMWCNFAANGNPSNANAVWKPFTDSQRNFLIIDREVECVSNVDDENIKFWENLYNEADLEAR
ncbi:carboxylesterase CXE26 [Danaus plexippus plexippus]|uniref:Carboxylesterase CXE26 n=1 Tax=Danaus plexippus plexippus TaxID=278856 RepID=A0A212F3K3_DANPL|nr:carboxylesterase CXE26 [Danaus plexippus plexippus]